MAAKEWLDRQGAAVRYRNLAEESAKLINKEVRPDCSSAHHVHWIVCADLKTIKFVPGFIAAVDPGICAGRRRGNGTPVLFFG